MALDVPARARRRAGSCAASSGRTRRSTCCRWPTATTSRTRRPTLDDPAARLTVREHAGAPATAMPRSAWRFARRATAGWSPTPRHVHLEGGFAPGRIYDLVYRAVDPPRRRARLAGRARHGGVPALGAGRGRQPVRGRARARLRVRRLAERALPAPPALSRARRGRAGPPGLRRGHAARGGRRGAASSTCASASPRSTRRSRWAACSRSPTRRRRSRHRSARRPARPPGARAGAVPRIIATNTSAEYWRGDASLVHTDVEGRRDVEPAADARVYLFAGTQHTPGALPPPPADPNTGSRGHPPLQRRRLRAAAARGAGQPRPLGARRASSRRRARSRGWPTARRCTRESTAPRFAAIPGVRFPDRTRAARRASTSAPTSSAASPASCRRRSARQYPTLRAGGRCRRQRDAGHPAGRAARRRWRRSRAGTRGIPSRARRATSCR